jgi:hypothetical protein
MSTDDFMRNRALADEHRCRLHIAASRTFDDACMDAALIGSELFGATLDKMPVEQIEALVAAAKVCSAYFHRARDFKDACEVDHD